MNALFEHTSSQWVRYSNYEWKKAEDGNLYLTPMKDAQPQIYDPLRNAEQLVVDALNIGRMCMSRKPDADIQASILDFAGEYGLFGLMTALPTTPKFMDYKAVYLPINPFITDETMETTDYLRLFFPFRSPEVVKNGLESMWNLAGDRTMLALALTMSDQPMAVNMSFQRDYAERYDWLKRQFTDWIFLFTASYLYYKDYEISSEDTRQLYRESMAAFDGNAPRYHIALYDKPTIVWDFHSLLLGIQLMFSFMLTDAKNPLRLCKHCTKVFVANRPSNQFCSPECKNRYNVYISRAKKEEGN